MYASSKDVTKEKLYEQQLEKQKKELEFEKSKLQTILHNLPDHLWIKDIDGKYITCNKRFESLYGVKIDKILGKDDYEFVNKELADFFKALQEIHDQQDVADWEKHFGDLSQSYLNK